MYREPRKSVCHIPFQGCTICSPFMLDATLHLILTNDGSAVAKDIQQNLYVDNVISGCDNEESAVQYYRRTRNIMSKAKFNLKSWASNNHHIKTVA